MDADSRHAHPSGGWTSLSDDQVGSIEHGRIENALALQRMAQEGRDRLESIVQSSSDLILILGEDGAIETLMGSVEPVFGPDWPAARGGLLIDRVHPADRARVAAFCSSLGTRARAEPQEVEFRLRHADGSHRHIAAAAANLLDDPRVEGIVLTARDVDARKALEEQLRHRAFHDPLTGLANRALFYDRVEHALSRARRDEGHVAVLFVDLDDFKPVNDRCGHAAGDQVLEEVARRLDSCVRSADTVARLGGDEFGVLLEDVSGPSVASETAERVIRAFATPFATQEHSITVSASVGVAASAPGERGSEDLLRKGDLAMYAAKAHGKARIELYQPDLERVDTPASERGRWFRGREEQREEIISVLEDPDALTMVFQPIMDLRSGRVAGYEALARFQRTPPRPPNEWFAQAHRCGLGYALEAQAIARALATPDRPVIKLDRTLTTGIDTEPVKAPLVGSFVRYARDISATVCAEGVETPAELARLADLDVAFGQGYLIARPAKPWTGVSREAAAACLTSFAAALRDWDATPDLADHDRRLERLAARIARSTSRAQLEACLPVLARELDADEIRIVDAEHARTADREIRQLLAGDRAGPGAERHALTAGGYGARLTIPVQRGADVVAALELYHRSEQPWTRFQIARARLIAHQLGAPLSRAGTAPREMRMAARSSSRAGGGRPMHRL